MPNREIKPPVYIDSNESLARFCQHWSACDMLALDTEFIRTDTFYPKGALLQVSDGNDCYLIDPLVINDYSPLVKLLIDESIVKVLHSCSEDLEVFERLFAVYPRPVFDTQIAAAMDGHGFSLGYQAMTEKLLGIHVQKGETRSNWLQRPLTDSQIHYAALDVEYLPEMYRILSSSLQQKSRLTWLQEECQLMLATVSDEDKISNYYLKVKSAWKLSGKELTRLQEITIWREREARRRNMPRGRILKDRCCLDIARLTAVSMSALSTVEDMAPRALQKYGEILLECLKNVQERDKSLYLSPLPRPLPVQAGGIVKTLKATVARRSEQLEVAPEILAKKKDYEQLVRSGFGGGSYQLPPTLSGWRKSVVGDDLLGAIAADHSDKLA